MKDEPKWVWNTQNWRMQPQEEGPDGFGVEKAERIRTLSQLFKAGAIGWNEVRKALDLPDTSCPDASWLNNAPERPEQITPAPPPRVTQTTQEVVLPAGPPPKSKVYRSQQTGVWIDPPEGTVLVACHWCGETFDRRYAYIHLIPVPDVATPLSQPGPWLICCDACHNDEKNWKPAPEPPDIAYNLAKIKLMEEMMRDPPQCKCYRCEPDRDTQYADIMTGGDGKGWTVTENCPIHRKAETSEPVLLDQDTKRRIKL